MKEFSQCRFAQFPVTVLELLGYKRGTRRTAEKQQELPFLPSYTCCNCLLYLPCRGTSCGSANESVRLISLWSRYPVWPTSQRRFCRPSVRWIIFGCSLNPQKDWVETVASNFNRLGKITGSAGTEPTRSAHGPAARKGLQRNEIAHHARSDRHSSSTARHSDPRGAIVSERPKGFTPLGSAFAHFFWGGRKFWPKIAK